MRVSVTERCRGKVFSLIGHQDRARKAETRSHDRGIKVTSGWGYLLLGSSLQPCHPCVRVRSHTWNTGWEEQCPGSLACLSWLRRLPGEIRLKHKPVGRAELPWNLPWEGSVRCRPTFSPQPLALICSEPPLTPYCRWDELQPRCHVISAALETVKQFLSCLCLC